MCVRCTEKSTVSPKHSNCTLYWYSSFSVNATLVFCRLHSAVTTTIIARIIHSDIKYTASGSWEEVKEEENNNGNKLWRSIRIIKIVAWSFALFFCVKMATFVNFWFGIERLSISNSAIDLKWCFATFHPWIRVAHSGLKLIVVNLCKWFLLVSFKSLNYL